MYLIPFILTILSVSSFALGKKAEPRMQTCPDPPYNNALAKIIYDGLEAFRPRMEEGAPELGIPPLDPLGPLPNIPISMDNEYVVLDGWLNETTVYNLAKYIVCEVDIEIGVRQHFYLDLVVEDFRINGTYDINGTYVKLFPIFGNGRYSLDVYNASLIVDSAVSYNVITGHAQLKDLVLNITFDQLVVYFECILGCGQMSDFVNNHLSDIATAIFNAVWAEIGPILSQAIENGINHILDNVKIPPEALNSRLMHDAVNLPNQKIRFPLKELLQAKP